MPNYKCFFLSLVLLSLLPFSFCDELTKEQQTHIEKAIANINLYKQYRIESNLKTAKKHIETVMEEVSNHDKLHKVVELYNTFATKKIQLQPGSNTGEVQPLTSAEKKALEILVSYLDKTEKHQKAKQTSTALIYFVSAKQKWQGFASDYKAQNPHPKVSKIAQRLAAASKDLRPKESLAQYEMYFAKTKASATVTTKASDSTKASSQTAHTPIPKEIKNKVNLVSSALTEAAKSLKRNNSSAAKLKLNEAKNNWNSLLRYHAAKVDMKHPDIVNILGQMAELEKALATNK